MSRGAPKIAERSANLCCELGRDCTYRGVYLVDGRRIIRLLVVPHTKSQRRDDGPQLRDKKLVEQQNLFRVPHQYLSFDEGKQRFRVSLDRRFDRHRVQGSEREWPWLRKAGRRSRAERLRRCSMNETKIDLCDTGLRSPIR